MQGTLDDTPLPGVVQSLCASGKSGVLHVTRGATTKRVYFQRGAIVFASSDDSAERLGERLVRAGAIKRSVLDLACRVTEKSHLRLGTTLVEMGYLSPADLDARVKDQVSSIVQSVVPWETGVFRTELKDQPIEPDLARRDLSAARLLLEGVRLIDDRETIQRGIGNLEGILRPASDGARLPRDLELTIEEGYVLSRVDGKTSAREIAKLSPLGEEETLRCVYALLAAGLLETAEPAPRPAPAPEHGPSPESLRIMEDLRRRYRRASEQTHYEVLGVPTSAVLETIKNAYFRLAKQLHPDQRARLKLHDPEGIADAYFLRIKEAYEVLSSESQRRRYDFALLQRAERQARAQATAAANPLRGESAPAETPEKRAFTAQQAARIHFANGERFFHEGRFHEAVEELRAAVRLDLARGEYHRLLGRALAKNPKWRKQAEEAFGRALDINRFDAESYLELGELYLAGGLGTKARKAFEEALAVDPDSERAIARLTGRREGATPLGRLKSIIYRARGKH